MMREANAVAYGLAVLFAAAVFFFMVGWVPYRVFGMNPLGAPPPGGLPNLFAFTITGVLYSFGIGFFGLIGIGASHAIGVEIIGEIEARRELRDKASRQAEREIRAIEAEIDAELTGNGQ